MSTICLLPSSLSDLLMSVYCMRQQSIRAPSCCARSNKISCDKTRVASQAEAARAEVQRMAEAREAAMAEMLDTNAALRAELQAALMRQVLANPNPNPKINLILTHP